jgi:hypothetical protein
MQPQKYFDNLLDPLGTAEKEAAAAKSHLDSAIQKHDQLVGQLQNKSKSYFDKILGDAPTSRAIPKTQNYFDKMMGEEDSIARPPAQKISIPKTVAMRPANQPTPAMQGGINPDQRAAQFEVLKKSGALSTLTPEQFETLVAPLRSSGWEVGKDYVKPPVGVNTPLWNHQTGGLRASVVGEGKAAPKDPRAQVADYVMDIAKPLAHMAIGTAKGSAQVLGMGPLVGGRGLAEGAKGLYKLYGEPQTDQYKKAMEIAQAKGYTDGRRAMADPEVAGHFMAALIPMFGPMAATAGEQLGTGEIRGFSQSMIMLAAPEIFKMVKGGVPLKDAAIKAVEDAKAAPATEVKPAVPIEQGFGDVPSIEAKTVKPAPPTPRSKPTPEIDPAQTIADAQDKIRQGVILSPGETAAMKAAGLTVPEYSKPHPTTSLSAPTDPSRTAMNRARERAGVTGEPEPLTGKIATQAEMDASLQEALKGKTAPMDRAKLGELPEVPNTVLSKLEQAAADARARLDAKAKAVKEGTLKEYGSGGLSSEDLIDYATIGALHITRAGMKFAEWSARMVEDLGDQIKPHLSEIWARSQGYLKQAMEAPEGQKPRNLPQTLEEHGMLGGDERFYNPSSNLRTLDRAEQIAQGVLDEKGVDGAVEWLRGSDVIGAEQTATGQLLIDKLQDQALAALDDGNGIEADRLMTKAQDVADVMAVRLTRYGQAVQAVQILGKMHPGRVVQAAQKVLDGSTLGKGRKLTTEEKVDLVREAKGIQSTAKRLNDAKRMAESSDDPKWQDIIDEASENLKQRRKKQAKRIENLDKLGKAGRITNNLWNFPKSLWFAFDLSWSGRQGAIYAWNHPIKATKTLGKAAKAFISSKEGYQAMSDDLQADPMFGIAKKAMGVDFTIARAEGASGIESASDYFQSDLAEKYIPGVRQSDQAFSMAGNHGRLTLAKFYDRALRKMGATPETHPWEYQGAGEIINTLTGRSPISPATAKVMGPFLNSARWVKSRAQLLNPLWYGKLAIRSPRAAAMLMKDMMVFTGSVIATLEVANLAGKYGITDIGTSNDPDDPDFGKLRVGKSHYDLTGGMQQEVRFFARLIKAKRDMDKGFMFKRGPLWVDKTGKVRATPLEIIADFGRRKLAPVPGQAVDYLAGDTLDFEQDAKTGKSHRRPFGWKPYPGGVGVPKGPQDQHNLVPSGPVSLLVPGKLMLKNFEDAYQQDKWKGVLFATPEIVGVSTQTYQAQPKKAKQ